jgi:hypothetical protein
MKQLWPPKGDIGTQVEPSAPTQAPLSAPILVAQLTHELEMPATAKRVKNASRKEWDCIIQRRALPGLTQDVADDSFNPYTPPEKAYRPPSTPLRAQRPQSPSKINATPGWRKRAPPKQKQIFLPIESAQPIESLAVPDSSSPRKVSAMRLPIEKEAAALSKAEVATANRTEKPELPTFLGRIDRANSFANPGPIPPPKYQVQKNDDPDGLTSPIFAGKRIRTIGEANCAALCQELESAGAALINTKGAEVDFYVVRLAGYALSRSCECISLTVASSGANLMKQETSEDEYHKFRTECWVERCIFESRICEVDENVTFRPLSVPTPLAGTASGVCRPIGVISNIGIGASQLFVASSGLDFSEQTWVKRLLRVLGMSPHAFIIRFSDKGIAGMNWSPAFSKKCTHLLCPSKQGPKYDRAREWNTLIVDLKWLGDIATSGRIPCLHPTSFADITNGKCYPNNQISCLQPSQPLLVNHPNLRSSQSHH